MQMRTASWNGGKCEKKKVCVTAAAKLCSFNLTSVTFRLV